MEQQFALSLKDSHFMSSSDVLTIILELVLILGDLEFYFENEFLRLLGLRSAVESASKKFYITVLPISIS